MTLIVGIRCKEGVVVAADSAVTFGVTRNQHTISDKVRKIHIVKDKIILAGTGEVGLGQRFCRQLELLREGGTLKGNDPIEMGRVMAKAAIEDFAATHTPMGGYGALVAFPTSKTIELCEFPGHSFQPELKTDQLWYASMGSGQTLADPYLRLIRHIFWKDGPPSLETGRFAAMWVMMHSIQAAPGYIAEPIDMAILSFEGKESRARMLDEKELLEHSSAVDGATEYFRKFEDTLRVKGDSATAPVPKMGS